MRANLPYIPPHWIKKSGTDPREYWANAEGSNPKNATDRAYYADNARQVLFAPPAAYDPLWLGDQTRVAQRGLWGTSVLDLRPDLMGSMGPTPSATPVRGGQSFGGGVPVAVLFEFTTLPQFMNVFVLDFVHLTNPSPNSLVRVNNVQDVSADFYDGMPPTAPSPFHVLLRLYPPDGCRYWQGLVVFDVLERNVAPELPTITVTATAY